jgi:selenocysteine lyase/cysteine desulfurase
MGYVETRVLALTDMLCEGLKKKGYVLHSPRGITEKSGIISFSPAAASGVDALSAKLSEAHVVHTNRYGMIRLSPHFYNSETEVETVINLL